jgi:uncharacterized protein YifE (UPF0438 family)
MHSQESEIMHVYTVATKYRMPVSLGLNSVVNVQSSIYKRRMPDTKWCLFIRWRPTFKDVTHANRTLKHAAVSVGEAQVLKSFSESFRRSTTGEHQICSRKQDETSFILTNTVRPRFIDGMPVCAKYNYITRKNKIAYPLSCISDVNRRKARRLPDLSANCAVFCRLNTFF